MQKRIRAAVSLLAVALMAAVTLGAPAQAAPRKMHGVPPGPGRFSAQSVGYFYAGMRQTVPAGMVATTDGLYANMDVWQATTNGNPDHSLGEISIQKDGGLDGVIEAGYWNDNGSTGGPRLFVSRWTNGTWGGDYNGVTDGFIKCTTATCGANSVVTLGTNVTSGVLRKFLIQHVSFGAGATGWGVWMNTTSSGTCTGGAGTTCWVGYYPDSLWTGASPPVSFTTVGFAQVFGEVTNDDSVDGTPQGTCSNMGSASGSGTATNPTSTVGAAMGSLQFTGSSVPTVDFSSYVVTNSSYYNMVPITSGSPARTIAMRYGGGGAC